MIRTFIAPALAALLAIVPAAQAQQVVTSAGEVTGASINTDLGCAASARTCFNVRNASRAFGLEVVEITYISTLGGRVSISPLPVYSGGLLQCVLPSDGRACAPVLFPGQMGRFDLPVPLMPGELITVRMRQWDPPGPERFPALVSSWGLNTPAGGMEVLLMGDPVAAAQAPALPAGTKTVSVRPGATAYW